jgi:hypothetical protein
MQRTVTARKAITSSLLLSHSNATSARVNPEREEDKFKA